MENEPLPNPPRASTLPPPPTPPPELEAPAPSPADPSATPAPLSPEQLRSAAEDCANGTAMIFDLILTRRGWTPTSKDELRHMADKLEPLVKKYPALATPSKYPELGVAGMFLGMVFVRIVAERETLAKEAEEKRRAEGQGAGS